MLTNVLPTWTGVIVSQRQLVRTLKAHTFVGAKKATGMMRVVLFVKVSGQCWLLWVTGLLDNLRCLFHLVNMK